MFVIYQSDISGPLATAQSDLPVLLMDEYDATLVALHMRHLGYPGPVPAEFEPFSREVSRQNAAGEEVLSYRCGVAELVVVDDGDPADPPVASIAELVDGVWTLTRTYRPLSPAYRLQLSPVEFKMLFTPAERVAIRQARSYVGDDPAKAEAALFIDDWWSIIDDPRLSTVDLTLGSTVEGIEYLVSAGLIASGRCDEITRGLPI